MAGSMAAAAKEPSHGVQLGVVQEVLLALLAKESTHAYQLRALLQLVLGPLAEALKEGQVYVTLNRLEKAGLVDAERVGPSSAKQPERKVYALTPAGRDRVTAWLRDTSWPKPAPAEFHLKLVAAAAVGSDPARIVDTQRHAVLAELAAVQRAALAEPAGSVAGLLLESVVLRLQADVHWLETCARFWTDHKGGKS